MAMRVVRRGSGPPRPGGAGGRVCTHRFLLERVWGPSYGDESHYLRVYMANLRKKLDDPSAPQLLLTEPGMGYRFVVPGAG
jgi:two-component system, OmpR family, KDP operon response regulator KdpE